MRDYGTGWKPPTPSFWLRHIFSRDWTRRIAAECPVSFAWRVTNGCYFPITKATRCSTRWEISPRTQKQDYPDFHAGAALQLSGTAQVLWDDPRMVEFKGAQRLTSNESSSCRRLPACSLNPGIIRPTCVEVVAAEARTPRPGGGAMLRRVFTSQCHSPGEKSGAASPAIHSSPD